ncbi:GNAT family N-acetyltransferase [Kocuria sp.]|uniref:GNAT family N-acetyltransferase n=1 Tax=Kocuria sp. TaxID=1871328 RepID=UPI0026DF1B19|nr:GNAT family N-acetyltransferase [Kocuria sp.]MDO5617249.1 GNAT family N-acetyltransferase [Kocuria sp.]
MPNTVTLRPITIQDAEVMVGVLSDPTLYQFMGGEPPTVAELEQRYTIQTRGQSPDRSAEWINMAVVLDPGQKLIGYVQATVPHDGGPTEIAWVIGRPWQGQGHASRAAELLFQYLRQRGVCNLVAHVHPEHAASQAIASKLGMTPTEVLVDGETRWET